MTSTILRCCAVGALLGTNSLLGDEYHLHSFDVRQLTDVYYSEGISVGDINGDGITDAVHGPFWFAGPNFETKSEIYAATPQPRERYADNFFSWVYDFDGDGHNDVFTVGFPGTPAHVYQNPGPDGLDSLWTKHEVFDWVSNESPQLTNLVGDERPELVCTRDGQFGYATIDWDKPFETWTFHAISEQIAPKRFGHGLGVGDINGDGRNDVITKDGWFEQPAAVDGDPKWTPHPVTFARGGGADMYAYDVDGDGDNDVITSLNAHTFGLAWHEQIRDGDEITFQQHVIMNDKPEHSRYGLVFTELHSVNLADMDGDGLKDIVTGKTYWSHHTQSPLWDAGAVVYWFKLVRGNDGVDWVPHRAAADTGIGRQVVVDDINKDGLPDIAVGGMKGANVLLQRREQVTHERWLEAQPKPFVPLRSGLSPEDAAKRMTVPDGFRVQLAAGEPTVHQPVAFCYDHRGRLWVAEAYTYPQRAPDGEGRDRIIILEDTDLDGTLDSRKVFIERLNLVSGLEVGFGGVWVAAAPYLMFIPDRDGDDVPDAPGGKAAKQNSIPLLPFPNDVPAGATALLDGFGYQDTHEVLNSLTWGPDGWLYGCHGVFTYSHVGKPGTPDEQRIPLNAGVWRYHPTRHEFEVFARGTSNPWGVDFDRHGQAFITACVIPHLWHVIPGARYHRQGGRHFNPHVYDDIKTIADHSHFVGNIRDHAWWGHEPTLPVGTSQAGGGHAHCGAMIYLGDNWPERYRHHIYFNNIHGNRVNCDIFERHGSGFVGHHGRDLLLANDRWFRGINLKYGPDGSVHLIDWYDRNACHRSNPEIWDRTNGRIYRIAYGDVHPQRVDLNKLSDTELVDLQRHANEWYVRTARRLLQERAADGTLSRSVARAALRKIVGFDPNDLHKLRAVWCQHVIGDLNDVDFGGLLMQPDENLRAWAIRLQTERGGLSAERVRHLTLRTKDEPSPLVRLQAAASLQRLPLQQRWSIAESLAARGEDADDHNIPLMLWYAVEPLVTADPSRALRLADSTRVPLLARYILRRAASEDELLDQVVRELSRANDPNRQSLILEELLAAFEGRVEIEMPPAWSDAYEKLAGHDDPAIRNQADQVAVLLGDRRIFPRMRQLLADSKADIGKRKQALEILVRGRDSNAAASLLAAVAEPNLRSGALRALAAFDDAHVATAILRSYSSFADNEKRDAINTLTARPASANALLNSIERGDVPRTDLHAYNVRQLLRFDDKKLNERLRTVWGEVRETSAEKRKQIAQLKTHLTADVLKAGDLGNGRRLFSKSCASCHTLFGLGGKIGPDITGSNRANLDYILDNIIDPSAVMGRDYRMTVIATEDGRIVSGLIQKETDSALTVRTINDSVVVAKADIDERSISDLSMMPERLLDPLSPAEVRDLVAYLGSPSQVPLKGPPAPIEAKSGRVASAIEAETIAITEKTSGNARAQGMGGFKADRWSGGSHLWWTGAKPGAKLVMEFPLDSPGTYEVNVVLTRARDYGIVQLKLDGKLIGGPIDLFNPEVVTTGVLSFDAGQLDGGTHKFSIEILGANPRAVKSYMVGLDYLQLVPARTGPNSDNTNNK